MPRILYLSLLLTIFFISRGEQTKLYMIVNSHLDAGWLSTFDQYYTGQGTPWGESAKNIYDNIVGKLEQNGAWTYSISEVCFFARWWSDQPESMRARVKQLLKNKQLEFVNGGWVAHDEATTTYEDMLENLAQGSVWLLKNLDVEVDIGWQLDSFGTSSTHASLLAQAGYRILFFSRLDFMERQRRRNSQELEFVWKPSNPLNKTLLTHIFGFGYEEVPYLRRANYISQAFRGGMLSESDYADIASYANQERKAFKSPNLLFSITGDFYSPARDYNGMQGIVDHFSNENDLSVKFSTLANFTDSLFKNLHLNDLQVKTDDFFPYIQTWDSTWSGYFSSKSGFKSLVRATSHYLNAVRSLYLRMSLQLDQEQDQDLWKALTNLGQVVSILQHHDAITGTSKERVRHDYEDLVRKAILQVEEELAPLLQKFLDSQFPPVVNRTENLDENNTTSNQQRSLAEGSTWDIDYFGKRNFKFIQNPISWSNINAQQHQDGENFDIPPEFLDSISGQDHFRIFSFNPGVAHETVVSLTLPKRNVYHLRVQDIHGQDFYPDIFCLNIPSNTCFMKWTNHFTRYESKIYKVIKDSSFTITPISEERLFLNDHPSVDNLAEININQKTSFALLSDYKTLTITKCEEAETSALRNCHTSQISLQYMSYTSSPSSGAYAFDPAHDGAKESLLKNCSASVYRGRHFLTLELWNLNMSSKLIFSTSNTEETAGFEIVTSINGRIADSTSCEVVLSLKYLDLLEAHEGTMGKDENEATSTLQQHPFFVDTNGYFIAARIYGQKDNSTGSPGRNIARNFYPMTTMIAVNDTTKRMTVITDRAQGVTKIPSGEVEIMLHRVTRADDNKGVNEPLDEKEQNSPSRINVTTRHFIVLTDSSDAKGQARLKSLTYEQPVQLWMYTNSSDEILLSKKDAGTCYEEELHDTLDSKYLKMNVLDSNEGAVTLRLQNIHDSREQAFFFCDNNSLIASPFARMLALDSNTYQIGISTLSEQHLVNHKFMSNISCTAPIQFLPQEMRTFQIRFNKTGPKIRSCPGLAQTDSSISSIHSFGSSNNWLIGLSIALSGLYLIIGFQVHKKTVSNSTLRPNKCIGRVCVYFLFELLWPLILLVMVFVKVKPKIHEKLLHEAEPQTGQEEISYRL